MNKLGQWRFPPSDHGKRRGISTGDDEAFKKSPYKSFAREVLQNSIDAGLKNGKPVRVEFNEFEIDSNEIPGIDQYRKAIQNIIEFWKHKKEYVNEYTKILDAIDNKKIQCLKISDYNTTGLLGVGSESVEENKFVALTQGAGVSEKDDEVSGGSKGIGKNAAFELSKLKMVFYSTVTKNGEVGSIGVTELISGYVEGDDSEKRDYTQGTGYYVSDAYNTPLDTVLYFEQKNNREDNTGTDIFIIGFERDDDWEKEVINSILDSFMAAIIRKELEVSFNKIHINFETIMSIAQSDIIFEKNRANIISQLKILSGGDDIQVFDIETEFGTPKLYVWVVPKNHEDLATHECAMIRHPLMKIKTFPISQSFNVSAVCIIENDNLGKQLLKIENPQHIDWEAKRIKDKTLRSAITKTLKDIRTQINDIVIKCLKLEEDEPIDPYGAGEFLPEDLGGDSSAKIEKKSADTKTETITVSKRKETRFNVKKTPYDAGVNTEGITPSVGGVDSDNPGDINHPFGENEHQGGKSYPGDEPGKETEGDSITYKAIQLTGIKFKPIAVNKDRGDYKIKFISPGDYDNCYLTILLVDDSNNRIPVEIKNLTKDGNSIVCDDNIEFGPFAIKTNEDVTLDVTVNEDDYFSSEVRIICK